MKPRREKDPPSERPSQRDAFTAIELLTILALIGLLAAFFLPTFSHATERGRRVKCRNNLKQFHLTLQMYGAENNGVLPSGIRDDKSESLSFISTEMRASLVRYASGSDKFLVCPNLDLPAVWGTNGGWYDPKVGFSIGYFYLGGHNDTPWGPVSGYSGWISPRKLSDDPNLVLITDASTWTPTRNWTVAPHGTRGPIVFGEPVNQRKGGGVPVQSVGISGCNVIYLNGSVRWKPVSQMNQYLISGFGSSYFGAW